MVWLKIDASRTGTTNPVLPGRVNGRVSSSLVPQVLTKFFRSLILTWYWKSSCYHLEEARTPVANRRITSTALADASRDGGSVTNNLQAGQVCRLGGSSKQG